MLQGILKCRHCGGNLIGHGGKLGIRYYVCSTYYSKTKAACKGQWIKAEPVEAQARNILKAAVSNKRVLELAREELTRMVADRNPELLAGMRLLERQLRELSEQHRKLLELRYKEAISIEQFKEENNRLIEQQKVVQQELDQLRHQREQSKTKNASLDRTFEVLQNFDVVYDSLNFKAKKDLYNSVLQFAHAKCLGAWKPKYIDDYELTEPFKLVSMGEVNNDKQIVWKNQCENSSIQSLHMAGQ